MTRNRIFGLIAPVLVLCLVLFGGNALAATYNLTAVKGCISLPDGTITEVLPCPAGTTAMWGLKRNDTLRWLFEEGQALTVNDGTLTVNLTNNLGVPTSLWLPGQTMTNNTGPVWFTAPDSHTLPANPYTSPTITGSRGVNLTARVRSFAHEVAPTATGAYTWGAVKPGTFILQSGTQPALQVPMGLYGAVTVTGGGYPGVAFDTETLLLYSEIDPVINNAVTDVNAGLTGTFHYKPKYFLVNGKPFTPGVSSLVAGTAAQTTLVRLANAGLYNHTAMMLGAYMTVRGEDGNIYPATKQNALNTVLLTAGKTIDATLGPVAAGYYPVFDRRLYLANNMAPSGGLMSYLRVPSGVDATLNVTAAVAGPGTPGGKVIASSMPGGIECATVNPIAGGCTEVVNATTNMALQAVPNTGSTYRWTTVGAGLCPKAKGICEVASVGAPVTAISAEFRPLSNLAVFRSGNWYVDLNGNGAWDAGVDGSFNFGLPTDVPVVGDWNGTGKAQFGLFRSGSWYLDLSENGAWDGGDGAFGYGIATDVPVVGDWSGDGKTKVGVYRNGSWYLDYKGTGAWVGCGSTPGTDRCYIFGMPTDIPVVGDWSGNGISKIGVFRNGSWYLDYNGNGVWDGCGAPADATKDACYAYGLPTDLPVVSDWSGDGISKIGVFRNGDWYVDYKGSGAWLGCGAPADPTRDACFSFGLPTDKPVAGGW